MALVLNEDQKLLKETAAGFFKTKAPVSALRSLRDNKDEQGFDSGLWSELSEMGFTGVLVSEDNGGMGFGHVGAGVVMEEKGKNLSPSPLYASAMVGASLLEALGETDLLASVVSGEKLVTLALDEGRHFDPYSVATSAVQNGDSYALKGMKTFVPDGHVADHLIVVARTSGDSGDKDGLSFFKVDKGAKGLIIDRTAMADYRNWAKVTLENAAGTLIGKEGDASIHMDDLLARANIVLSSELLGIAQRCFDDTVAYLKERKQFGVIIGTFQALQHRAAHWFSEIEVTRSAVLKAQTTADMGASGQALHILASIAKARACKTAELSTNEAIQLHGGIGMTDEMDIGFFIKRARTAQKLYGDYSYHADRYATLIGI